MISPSTRPYGVVERRRSDGGCAAPGAQAIFAALESNGTVELGALQLPLSVQDFRWIGFVGKILTGNHRFSHEDHGVFLLKFSQQNHWRTSILGEICDFRVLKGPLVHCFTICIHLWGIPSFVLGKLSQLQTMIAVVQSQSIPCFITIFRYFHHQTAVLGCFRDFRYFHHHL